MANTKRYRQYLLTINYKETQPLGSNEIQDILQSDSDTCYFVFQLEQGEQETKHHHIYVAFNNKKSFKQIKEMFPTAHIDTIRGTPQQVKDYCSKPTGVYEGKQTTQLTEPIEWGTIPQQGKRSDLAEILNRLEEGASIKEIKRDYPSQYMQYRNTIHTEHQDQLADRFMTVCRDINVVFLSDVSGSGKTYYITNKYGLENVYRVSDYKHPFDSYNGQDVLVFEEFRNDLPLKEMLQYLDVYPCMLRARYSNKVACYTKVYMVSNWDFRDIYSWHRQSDHESYIAFKRRIHFIGNLEEVKEYDSRLELPLEENPVYKDAIDIFGESMVKEKKSDYDSK